MVELAAGCFAHALQLVVIGDRKSPPDYPLAGARYFSIESQVTSSGRLAKLLPAGHYARKNLGYLQAIRDGAELIIDTDDDNFPRDGFWSPSCPEVVAPVSQGHGWVNVYRCFVDADVEIWPRGFPWQELHRPAPECSALPRRLTHCPIQQGLVDEDPDVDAVWRLIRGRRVRFAGAHVALGAGSWCPFNSQNTRWFPEAYPLLYLPASCSGRMTDIWRSFVAQRVMWDRGWNVLFHGPTMWQERNTHDLRDDIEAEFTGYARNEDLCRSLAGLNLSTGSLGDAMIQCYQLLLSMDLVAPWELDCLAEWLAEIP